MAMNKKNISGIWILLVIVVCGVLLYSSHVFLSSFQKESIKKEGDLYLPGVNHLKFIGLGHDGLISDLILARALVYYGAHYKDRKKINPQHLKKLFFTAAEMDPYNKDAFIMASNILSDVNIQDSIQILKQGMTYHPQCWKFPEMIGFRYFFNLNDSRNAAKYYEIASKLPGHPPYIPSLSGKFYQESGRYEEAIRILYNFYVTTDDKRLKKSFKENIERIQEKIKNREFLLKATVVKVIDAATIEFQKDMDNPLFQFLKPIEKLQLQGIKYYKESSNDAMERLFALFQKEFARYVLKEKKIKIMFHRTSKGDLVRLKDNLLAGTITLGFDRSYQQISLGSGIFENPQQFPPSPQKLHQKKVFKHIGKIVSIEFFVQHVDFFKNEILLNAAPKKINKFQVLIPHKYIRNFEKEKVKAETYFRNLIGKQLTVSGFAGFREGKVIIKLYDPLQLKINPLN